MLKLIALLEWDIASKVGDISIKSSALADIKAGTDINDVIEALKSLGEYPDHL